MRIPFQNSQEIIALPYLVHRTQSRDQAAQILPFVVVVKTLRPFLVAAHLIHLESINPNHYGFLLLPLDIFKVQIPTLEISDPVD